MVCFYFRIFSLILQKDFMKKLLIFLTLFTSITSFAQHTWYDLNEAGADATLTTSNVEVTISQIANPDNPGDITANPIVTLFHVNPISTHSNKKIFVTFPTGFGLNESDITNLAPLTITIRCYFPSYADALNLDNPNRRFRVYIGNSYSQVKLENSDEGNWHNLTFTLDGDDVLGEGFIESIELRFVETNAVLSEDFKFYVDSITANKELTTDISLSIDEYSAALEAGINLYPNPVTNSFQIDSKNNIETVKLYDITGNLSKAFTSKSNYDISDLSAGVYIVNIKTQIGSNTLKVVKN